MVELVADLILLNGKVVTVDPKDTIAEAVAVKGGRIVRVGTSEEVRSHACMQFLRNERKEWLPRIVIVN